MTTGTNLDLKLVAQLAAAARLRTAPAQSSFIEEHCGLLQSGLIVHGKHHAHERGDHFQYLVFSETGLVAIGSEEGNYSGGVDWQQRSGREMPSITPELHSLLADLGLRQPLPDTNAATLPILIEFQLIKTTRRLTFDVLYQAPQVTYMGADDGPYFKFTASNGYEVISRSRMDIQTERLWLLGAKHAEESRSGSMVFSTNEKRDAAYDQFIVALYEWATSNGGTAKQLN